MGGGGSSSGPSDFNWITALGAGLQSAGAAHFGNYGVAQGYMQLKQQADMRKQMFAQQQAQLEEQKRQHSMGIMWDLIKSQNLEGLKAFGDQDKTEVGALARNIGMSMNQADLAELPEYLKRGWITPEELKEAHTWTPSRVKAKVATLRKRTDVVNKAMEDKALLHEAYRKQQAGEELDAYEQGIIEDHKAAQSVREADVRLKKAQAGKAEREAENGTARFTETSNVVSSGLFLKPGEALKPDELVTPEDVKRAQSLGETVVEGEPRLTALARIAQKSIPTSVAGAKAAASVENTQRVKLISGERLGNFVNRKAFIQGRTMGPSTALTEADAANPEWLELSDKQSQDLRLLNQAKASQDLVFDLAEGLGQMEGPGAAFVKGLKNRFGAYTRANPLAAAFMGDRKAFATYFRNLQESGVMTEQDRAAYESLLPDERETVASFKVKKVILREIMDISDRAYRAAIAKDDTAFNENRQAFKDALASARALTKAQKGDQKSLENLFEKRYGGAK